MKTIIQCTTMYWHLLWTIFFFPVIFWIDNWHNYQTIIKLHGACVYVFSLLEWYVWTENMAFDVNTQKKVIKTMARAHRVGIPHMNVPPLTHYMAMATLAMACEFTWVCNVHVSISIWPHTHTVRQIGKHGRHLYDLRLTFAIIDSELAITEQPL